MIELTKEEMLGRWLSISRLEPLRADCVSEREYGVDLEAVAEGEMRRWYLERLDHAPIEHLRLTNIATKIPTLRADSEGVVTVQLPQDVRRVASVWLSSWVRPAVPWAIESEEGQRTLWQSGCPFSRPGVSCPAALLLPGGVLRLYSASDKLSVPTLGGLLAVCDPGPERYVIDEAEFATIPRL